MNISQHFILIGRNLNRKDEQGKGIVNAANVVNRPPYNGVIHLIVHSAFIIILQGNVNL